MAAPDKNYAVGDVVALSTEPPIPSDPHYNTFNADIKEIVDRGDYAVEAGYGQVTNQSNYVQVGTTIKAGLEEPSRGEWTQLINSVNLALTHQEAAPTLVTHTKDLPAGGLLIEWFDILESSIATTRSNKFVVDPSNQLSVSNPDGVSNTRDVGADPILAPDGDMHHIFTASWTNFDAMRYFFNAGGYIQILPSWNGNSGDWNNILGAVDVRLDHGTDLGSIGFYDLPFSSRMIFETPVLIYTDTSGTETLNIWATMGGTINNASSIRFDVDFLTSAGNIPANVFTSDIGYTSTDDTAGVLEIEQPAFTNSSTLEDEDLPALLVDISSWGSTSKSCELNTSCPNTYTLLASANTLFGPDAPEYVWSITADPNSIFSITSGQGTNAVVVTAAPPGSGTATIQCIVTDPGIRDPGEDTGTSDITLVSTTTPETLGVTIDKIFVGTSSIYNGSGTTATASKSCSSQQASWFGSIPYTAWCANEFDFTAEISGANIGNVTVSWTLITSAGTFSNPSPSTGLTTATTSTGTGVNKVGLLRLKVHKTSNPSLQQTVDITMNSEHIYVPPPYSVSLFKYRICYLRAYSDGNGGVYTACSGYIWCTHNPGETCYLKQGYRVHSNRSALSVKTGGSVGSWEGIQVISGATGDINQYMEVSSGPVSHDDDTSPRTGQGSWSISIEEPSTGETATIHAGIITKVYKRSTTTSAVSAEVESVVVTDAEAMYTYGPAVAGSMGDVDYQWSVSGPAVDSGQVRLTSGPTAPVANVMVVRQSAGMEDTDKDSLLDYEVNLSIVDPHPTAIRSPGGKNESGSLKQSIREHDFIEKDTDFAGVFVEVFTESNGVPEFNNTIPASLQHHNKEIVLSPNMLSAPRDNQ